MHLKGFWLIIILGTLEIQFLTCLAGYSLNAEGQVLNSSLLMSDEEEIEFGRAVDEEIRRYFSVCTTYDTLQGLRDVGLKLIAVSDRKELPFVFRVLDSETLNAFSAPGGYIYVTSGLIGFVRNTDEIA